MVLCVKGASHLMQVISRSELSILLCSKCGCQKLVGVKNLSSTTKEFPCSSAGKKKSACNAGDPGSIPGLGRSPGEGNGNPLQYSCLENPMDRGAWQATVHGGKRVGHELATKPPPPTK